MTRFAIPLLVAALLVQALRGESETPQPGEDWVLPERPDSPPEIDFWYGEHQRFGRLGDPQPLVNVLGSIRPVDQVGDAWYQLNREKWKPLVLGPDLHRLARPGDFNVEIDRQELRPGENSFRIRLDDIWGRRSVQEITIEYGPAAPWSLPYEIDFSAIENLQDHVEVLDGRWIHTSEGVRTLEPYYDRQLAFGDSSWVDVELEAEIIFHRHFTGFEGRNRQGPPYLSHAHTSFNLRWAGHPDDGADPRRAWQNLGSLVALRCDLANPKAGSYWWMHYGFGREGKPAPRSEMRKDLRFQIEPEQRFRYRMRAVTLEDGDTRYSARVWRVGDPEPDEWQMEGVDQSETVAAGSIVFVVHHSDVTLCRIRVEALP